MGRSTPAIDAGVPSVGGKNKGAMHWDMVKDLRQGRQIECDGDVVQKDGAWKF